MSHSDQKHILVINPGSTTTKVAWFLDEHPLWKETISYSPEDFRTFSSSLDQIRLRCDDIQTLLDRKESDLSKLAAVVGRGGTFRPMESGTYRVNEFLIRDVMEGRVQADHISNIGVVLAYDFARKAGVSAFFVDPVCVDEFEPLARYSGMPELDRISLLHALNIKSAARKVAAELGNSISESSFIVAHLGGGISICAIKSGRMVDVNNANEEGPFSPERCGTLPASSLAKLCYSGKHDYPEIKRRIVGQGGLYAYLGTNDVQEVWQWIDEGNHEARIVLEAMIYQIAKEIGAMAAVLSGNVDAIILTGGICHDDRLMSWLQDRICFIAPVHRLPGEFEMEALAGGVLRVLQGEESEKEYPYGG
ncbi:butyrate kinase [bacterium]|nr:butyrate kinase [bacterium]